MKRFNKIIAFSLVFAVMLASSSFAVNMHFCCNKLVDMAFLTDAKVCDAAFKTQSKPSKDCSFDNEGCCDNKTLIKKGSDELQKTSFQLEHQNQISLHLFFYAYINIFKGLKKTIVPFLNYMLPLIPEDFQVLHEVYLI